MNPIRSGLKLFRKSSSELSKKGIIGNSPCLSNTLTGPAAKAGKCGNQERIERIKPASSAGVQPKHIAFIRQHHLTMRLIDSRIVILVSFLLLSACSSSEPEQRPDRDPQVFLCPDVP
jgi:hypothetical protein